MILDHSITISINTAYIDIVNFKSQSKTHIFSNHAKLENTYMYLTFINSSLCAFLLYKFIILDFEELLIILRIYHSLNSLNSLNS